MKFGDCLFTWVPEDDDHEDYRSVSGKVGDWIIVRTNKGPLDGTIHKINSRTVIVRLQIAGKFKYIKRHHGLWSCDEKNDVIDIIKLD